MKYYAVIDTNVLVSAMIKNNSVPGEIIKLAFNEVIVPIFNNEIIIEYRTVLSRPKFGLNDEIINNILNEFLDKGISLEAEESNMVLPDDKDVVFYNVVMEGRKSENAFLITGNIKHFPEKTFIVTPRQMYDIIVADEGLLQK